MSSSSPKIYNPNEFVIDVKNLKKTFGDKQAVVDASLQVKRGEIFGFLGPNGSGKTTTLRMICGLMKPTAGSGTCLAYDVLTQSDVIKLQVGYMTQAFTLYKDLSIKQNLEFIARLYGVPKRRQAVQDSLKELGLTDRQNQLAADLSGGWKQRLALSAALIHKPELLLLDEPTAGVDPQARRDFWAQVQKMSSRGITTLVTTHYMDEAVRCNKISYIVYGRTLVTGTAEEIIQNSGLITWEITGSNLESLIPKLEAEPGIEQVAAFGMAIHVSGQNAEKLAASIKQVINGQDYMSKKIESSLEDVFILLVDKYKDQRHEA